MTPRRPIELVRASIDCSVAWSRRDAMIDIGDEIGVQAMNTACDLLDERYTTLYRQWQKMGGTSDIESIALHDPRTEQERDWDKYSAEVFQTRELDRPF